MKRILSALLIFLLLVGTLAACVEETPTPEEATPPVEVLVPEPTPQATPEPTPGPDDDSRFVYENAVLGVKFSIATPADWDPFAVGMPLLPLYEIPFPGAKLFRGALHPSNWGDFYEPLAVCCAEQFWIQPDEPGRVFVTAYGITVVTYENTLIRTEGYDRTPFGTEEYAAAFVFRADGRDYREISDTQMFYTIFVVADDADTLEKRAEEVYTVLNSLRFYDEPPTMSRPISEIGQSLGITQTNFPRIDGSTSTLPLMREVIDVMLAPGPYWRTDDPYFLWHASRTVPSYELLIGEYLDLILVPEPSEHVLQLAETAGVELEFTPVAVEALVFITHADNPVYSVTTEQILGIYESRTVSNWSQLGGGDGPIIPLNRNLHSGSQTLMDNHVLTGRAIHPDLARYQLDAMSWMLEAVGSPWFYSEDTSAFALGYTVFFFLNDHNFLEEFNLKILALDGVFPSHETILSGEYPVTTNYFAVIRADTPENHPARRIANWLLTSDGQAAVEAAGLGTVR